MKKQMLIVLVAGWAVASIPVSALAHCQIPCGIYDDAARITRMQEDVTTIEKAIGRIGELAGQSDARSANQLGRWIMAKETHASHIITVVSEYFLTQRVKPVAPEADGYDAYLQKLADHHAVMSAAMKAKQNADVTYAAALSTAIDKLAEHYDTAGHEH